MGQASAAMAASIIKATILKIFLLAGSSTYMMG
jgi:hypothetical protein